MKLKHYFEIFAFFLTCGLSHNTLPYWRRFLRRGNAKQTEDLIENSTFILTIADHTALLLEAIFMLVDLKPFFVLFRLGFFGHGLSKSCYIGKVKWVSLVHFFIVTLDFYGHILKKGCL